MVVDRFLIRGVFKHQETVSGSCQAVVKAIGRAICRELGNKA